MFASDAGVVHSIRCRMRGQIVFRLGERQLEYLDWRQDDWVGVPLRGPPADQVQEEAVRARRRDEVRGPRSGYRTGGSAVALVG